MKGLKKALSIILAIIMVLSILPITITAESTTNKTSLIVAKCEVGDIIEFGSYPQTQVTDTELISKLNNLITSWTSYEYYSGTGDLDDGNMYPSDYMKYADVTYNGNKYRAVTFSQYRPYYTGLTCSEKNSYQDGNGYYINEVYWFNYEPISWRVLDPIEGYIICNDIIDAQAFNSMCYYNDIDGEYYQNADCKVYANNYKASSIREWLNNNFYNTAFTFEEQCEINYSKQCNNCYNSNLPQYDSATTYDKIFLLSYDEAVNSDYGFSTTASDNDINRKASGTDYAKCQGLYVPSWWRLRTADYDSNLVCNISPTGKSNNHSYVFSLHGGICPALKLNPKDKVSESSIMIQQMPKLSDVDARAFLGFIYGKMEEFSTADLENDIQYQLLTGTLPATKSVDEIKAIIDTFSLVVQEEIETHVSNSKYKCDYFLNSLISRLENEVAGLKTIDQQIISEYTSATSKYLEQGLTDLFAGAVGSITGIHISDSVLLDCKNIISGINTIASIPSKLEEFFNRVYMVSDTFVIIANHEKAGRYSYFSSYLNMRPTLDRDEYSWYYDMLFNSIRTEYFASEVFDWITPITGKDSWSNHRDDIERYAEFMLSLAQIGQQDFHNYKITKYLSSCTEGGYTEYDCTYCDYCFVDNVTEPLGHKYTKSTMAPTCEEQGYDLYQCKNCTDSYKDNYKNAVGHSSRTKTIVIPTCTTDGYTLNICKCGYTWQTDIVSALQHNYKQTIIEATETKQGYTVNICVNCNDTYYNDYTNPTGHEYTITTISATCEQDGTITHTCDCGDTYSEVVSATGHKYILDSYEAPTCTTEGIKTYKCITCDSTYTETEKILEHDYSYKTEFVDSTCEEQGYSINYCLCGETSITDYTDALCHSYIVVETVNAICTSAGANTLECELCGKTKTENIPALGDGHNYELIESSELSCETSQYELYECTLCKAQKYENTIALTGHTYELDSSNEPICTVCGKSRYNIKIMSSQIRFDRNEDGSYAETFAVRTRAKILDEDFKTLVGATNEEAVSNIEKVGFVYTLDGENFSAISAQAVAQGEKIVGYTDASVNYIQDADGYYMFTCMVTNIPQTETNVVLTAYAYICVNGKWYFSEAPMNADFNSLYSTYYPVACESYGWEQ